MSRDEIVDQIANITDKHHENNAGACLFYRINCASEIYEYLKPIIEANYRKEIEEKTESLKASWRSKKSDLGDKLFGFI